MKENSDGTFIVEWGRVGYAPQTTQYPMSQWNKKYQEKLKRGYSDITSLKIVNEDSNEVSIDDKLEAAVKRLIKDLQNFANDSIKANYTVSSKDVTIQQVEAAEKIIEELLNLSNKSASLEDINKKLIELYRTIPRKMKNVRNHVAHTLSDINKILVEEQDILDVMKQQVQIAASKKDTSKPSQSILDILGVDIKKLDDDKKREEIIKMMGADSNRVTEIFEVTNFKTQKMYDEGIDKSKSKYSRLLFHGSRNQNWLNIIKTGLLIRPVGVQLTGAMFGNGVYFANKAGKSIGYTSLQGSYWARGNDKKGYIALYQVNTGHELRLQKHESWMNSLDDKKLKSKGDYDSLYAKGGYDLRNDEFIVYQTRQSTIKYLIELK